MSRDITKTIARCIMCGRPIHQARVQRHAVGLDNLPTAVDGCEAAGQWIHHHDAFGRDVLTVFAADAMEIERQRTRKPVQAAMW